MSKKLFTEEEIKILSKNKYVRNVRKECESKEIKLLTHEKFIIIKSIAEKYNLKNKISYLCDLSSVSRSGYYNYFSKASISKRCNKEEKDLHLYNNILAAFNFKNRKKGARQIKMTLQNFFGINYNLKCIRRIMKKYNIVCPYRKANPYRRMMKATKEHIVLLNLLKREFKQDIPAKVLLTDITYLFFKNGQKAYLSTILDASTNEVLAHNVSKSLKIDIVTDALDKLIENYKGILRKDSFIHSDQGAHYTSPIFQNKVKEVTDYIDYHNNYRAQWNLKKMTPVDYRNHLLNIS